MEELQLVICTIIRVWNRVPSCNYPGTRYPCRCAVVGSSRVCSALVFIAVFTSYSCSYIL